MAQRTRLTREERRSRLLGAAADLFGRRGYTGTEVAEVARVAGVTKPVLYNHFPGGKAEIYTAVLERHLEILLKVLWEAMSSSAEPRERLYKGMLAYLEFAKKNPEAFRLLVGSGSRPDAATWNSAHEARELIARGLGMIIADAMKGAGLSDEGALVYAYSLLGSTESVTAWWLEEAKLDKREVAGYLLAIAWRGFDGLPRHPDRVRFP